MVRKSEFRNSEFLLYSNSGSFFVLRLTRGGFRGGGGVALAAEAPLS